MLHFSFTKKKRLHRLHSLIKSIQDGESIHQPIPILPQFRVPEPAKPVLQLLFNPHACFGEEVWRETTA